MDSDALGILLGNIFISFFIALLGRNREIGYVKSLLWCILTSPVIGLIRIMASDKIIQNDTKIDFEQITPQQMKPTTNTPIPQVNTTNTWTTTSTTDDDLFASQETVDDVDKNILVEPLTQDLPDDLIETETETETETKTKTETEDIAIFIIFIILIVFLLSICITGALLYV